MKKFWQKHKKTIKNIFKTFVIWRLVLLVIVFLGIKFFPSKIDYLGGGVANYYQNPLVWAWANFDGVHYLKIAKLGYGQFQHAFFPFYPWLTGRVAKIFGDYLFSGLLISHLAFLAALFLLFQLARLDFKKNVAQKTVFYLLLFPTAFFFGSVYSESLFLALVLASFFAARKKNWLLAGICGGLASATRFVGIFLFPALLIEWWQNRKGSKKHQLTDIFSLLMIVFGLVVYMWYLQKTVSDPLYFIHVQPFFGAERTGGKLILLYQVFWRYLKMIATTKFDPLYFAVWLELLSSLLFLILLVLTYTRLRLSYFVFMLLAYLTPTFTGTFSSMPRYVLVLFPGFMVLAQLSEKHRWLKTLYPILAIILTAISVIFFTRGYWVA